MSEGAPRAARRRLTPLLLLGALLFILGTAAVIAVTCNASVEGDSGDRQLNFVACTFPVPLCTGQSVTWKTWFAGNGDMHGKVNLSTFQLTDDYYYALRHWEHGAELYSVQDDDGQWNRPFGIELSMSTDVTSYSAGTLATFSMLVATQGGGYLQGATGNCYPVYIDPHHLYVCAAWNGTLDMGKPGGHGDWGASLGAVSGDLIVSPYPSPVDAVGDWPWYMYHNP